MVGARFARIAALAALGAVVGPACGAVAAPVSTMKWLLNGPALEVLAGDPSVKRFLAGAAPFVLQRKDSAVAVPDDWNAVPVRSYTSFAHIERAFETGAVDPRVRAILYDNEGWTFTPAVEQRDPAEYMRRAADLVHRHHLLFIAAPAVDITRTLAPDSEKRYDAYLRLNLAADAARYADVFNIQAQGSERDIDKYSTFVRRAAAQARAANPHVTVLAGISTNPSGQHVSADDVMRAIEATRTSVAGYWFNIPKPSAYCPGCNDFRPDIAIDVFKRLGAPAS